MENQDFNTTVMTEEMPESGKATASLVCGIVSLCLCGCMPVGVAGLILAILAKKGGNTSTKATVGMVLSIITLALWLISTIYTMTTGGIGAYTSMMSSIMGQQ
ncbi:hypothetical protein SAMN02910456_00730 [Ruminococcaceae bacterium YRB3002]|nr:hypothetical protein SAMN02910456_00730 [Ruminococcaceae bacterium YRB3002]